MNTNLPIKISSVQNSVYKKLRNLYKPKKAENLMLVEGRRSVTDAIKNGAQVQCVVYRNDAPLIDTQIRSYSMCDKLFDTICCTETPQDVLCVAKFEFGDNLFIKEGLYIVLDKLQDPGNMGSIIRTAHAVNAAGVVVTKGCASIFNPKVVRATMGSLFCVDIYSVQQLERAHGIELVAARFSHDSTSLFQFKFKKRTAVVIGNEGSGISAQMLAQCERSVCIPMPGGVESLNAAVATALISYEYLRQF